MLGASQSGRASSLRLLRVVRDADADRAGPRGRPRAGRGGPDARRRGRRSPRRSTSGSPRPRRSTSSGPDRSAVRRGRVGAVTLVRLWRCHALPKPARPARPARLTVGWTGRPVCGAGVVLPPAPVGRSRWSAPTARASRPCCAPCSGCSSPIVGHGGVLGRPVDEREVVLPRRTCRRCSTTTPGSRRSPSPSTCTWSRAGTAWPTRTDEVDELLDGVRPGRPRRRAAVGAVLRPAPPAAARRRAGPAALAARAGRAGAAPGLRDARPPGRTAWSPRSGRAARCCSPRTTRTCSRRSRTGR